MHFERKLHKVGETTLTLSIPSDLVQFLNLTSDSIMLIEEQEGIITIKKKV